MIKQKQNQNGFSAIEALIIILVIALIGVIGWIVYMHNQSNTYKIDKFYSEGHEFSIDFSAHAGYLDNNGVGSLAGWNIPHNTELVFLVLEDTKNSPCNYHDSLLTPFYISVDGNSFPVCTDSSQAAFTSGVEIDGKWYVLDLVPRNFTSSIDSESAKTIMQSFKVLS